MANLKKVNLEGQEVGEVSVDDALLKVPVNSQLIKDYVVAVRNNARQWSANSKGRSEIVHSNKKPHPQKGTGRARQGCLTVAQYRGGAAVFGPKPKFDQHVRINKKERRSAIRYLLAQKILGGNARVLQLEVFDAPKTKVVAYLISSLGIKDKRILFLGDGSKEPMASYFVKSARNISKVSCVPISSMGGYDVIKSQEVVVLTSALDQFMKALGSR